MLRVFFVTGLLSGAFLQGQGSGVGDELNSLKKSLTGVEQSSGGQASQATQQGQEDGGEQPQQKGDWKKYMEQYVPAEYQHFAKHNQKNGNSQTSAINLMESPSDSGSQSGGYQQYMTQYAGGSKGGSQAGNYQQYMKEYAGGQGGSQGYQKYMDMYTQGGQGGGYQQYMKEYAGGSQGGSQDYSKYYDKYMNQYAGGSQGGSQGGDYQQYYEKYMKQYTGGSQAQSDDLSNSATNETAIDLFAQSDGSQGGDYQQYMKKYTGGGQGGGYQKYMKQYAGATNQGGDYQQYMNKYAGGSQGGSYDQYMKKYAGSYQKYMSQYTGGSQEQKDDSFNGAMNGTAMNLDAQDGGSQGGNYQQYMNKYAGGSQGGGYKQYMEKYGGSQGGDYQQYMKKYAGSQGGDYQQYMNKYVGASQGGGYDQYMKKYAGSYQHYMSQYTGGSQGESTATNLMEKPMDLASAGDESQAKLEAEVKNLQGSLGGSSDSDDSSHKSQSSSSSSASDDADASQSQSGNYQQYMKKYAGGQGGGYQQYIDKYAGGSQGGSQAGGYQQYMKQYAGGQGGNYQQYMDKYTGGSPGGSQQGGSQGYQQYMNMYAKGGQGGNYQQYMKEYAGGSQGGSQDYKQYYEKYMDKYTGGKQGASQQGGDYQQYMDLYAKGGQGGDYQQYMKKYAGGSQGGSQGGDYKQYYEKYMKKYAGHNQNSVGSANDAKNETELDTWKSQTTSMVELYAPAAYAKYASRNIDRQYKHRLQELEHPGASNSTDRKSAVQETLNLLEVTPEGQQVENKTEKKAREVEHLRQAAQASVEKSEKLGDSLKKAAADKDAISLSAAKPAERVNSEFSTRSKNLDANIKTLQGEDSTTADYQDQLLSTMTKVKELRSDKLRALDKTHHDANKAAAHAAQGVETEVRDEARKVRELSDEMARRDRSTQAEADKIQRRAEDAADAVENHSEKLARRTQDRLEDNLDKSQDEVRNEAERRLDTLHELMVQLEAKNADEKTKKMFATAQEETVKRAKSQTFLAQSEGFESASFLAAVAMVSVGFACMVFYGRRRRSIDLGHAILG